MTLLKTDLSNGRIVSQPIVHLRVALFCPRADKSMPGHKPFYTSTLATSVASMSVSAVRLPLMNSIECSPGALR